MLYSSRLKGHHLTRNFLFSIAVLQAIVSLQANANDHIQYVRDSVKKFEATNISEWAYKLSTSETDGGVPNNTIEQFDPSKTLSQQWQLLEQNKKEPTLEQQMSYQRSKTKQREQDDNSHASDSMGINLKDLIDFDSVKLTDTTEQQHVFSFKANMDDMGEDVADAFDGILRYDRKHGYIKQIEIKNNTNFSPELIATIKSFTLIYDFVKIDNAILPAELRTNIKGTLGFFISFDEQSSEKFIDYKFIGQQSSESIKS